MPPELDLKDVSAQFLAELLSMLRGGREFVIEQAPDVIPQGIAWGFWSAAISACVAAAICAVASIAAWKFFGKARSAVGPCGYPLSHGAKYGEPCRNSLCADPEPWIAGGVICSLVAVCSFGFAVSCGLDAAHVAIAPKAWLLEQALRLAR